MRHTALKQTKQKGRRLEVPLPFRVPRLVPSGRWPVHVRDRDVLNFDVDLLHLQPREEVAQLRRAAMLPPLPAGNSQNEQFARAQLHAGNEADIDAPLPVGRAFGGASIEVPLTTHWTRVLHHDLYGANESEVASRSAFARLSIVAIAYRLIEGAIGSLLGWLTL